MTDLVEHIRQILEHHHIDDGAVNLANHRSHVAQQIVDRLELRKEAVGNKTRSVSAWFDGELTKLEGAE